MSTTEPPRAAGRLAGAVRASAGLGAAAGLLFAAVALATGARPWAGVCAWAWLALGFASLLLREAASAPGGARDPAEAKAGSETPLRLRPGRRPR